MRTIHVLIGLFTAMGSAGFEPTTSSARGWHHTKLDYDPLFDILLLLFVPIFIMSLDLRYF